ncbi:MAG: hypothetical protein ACOC26_04435 [Halochromatium sp.]|uniref:hypothetical protein n=1 Tax=Halochromatium sp. TaxID=2049430 RepID=UPI0039787819
MPGLTAAASVGVGLASASGYYRKTARKRFDKYQPIPPPVSTEGRASAWLDLPFDSNPDASTMFWTNVFLAASFVAMIAIFVWLFRDGEGPSPGPAIMRKPGHDGDDAQASDDDKP